VNHVSDIIFIVVPPAASCVASAGELPAILSSVGGICTLHLAATVLGMIDGARATRPPLAHPGLADEPGTFRWIRAVFLDACVLYACACDRLWKVPIP
jgi:hypothetical protein